MVCINFASRYFTTDTLRRQGTPDHLRYAYRTNQTGESLELEDVDVLSIKGPRPVLRAKLQRMLDELGGPSPGDPSPSVPTGFRVLTGFDGGPA
jgi:hypothetical protein